MQRVTKVSTAAFWNTLGSTYRPSAFTAVLACRQDEVAARAKQDISRARSRAVILAFMAGAAALLGAIAAWAAAVTAGRYRDGQEAIPALWDWGSESRSLFSKNTR